ncbi:oxidoreductase [Streptomyces mobaraensis]|uniref:SDR family NAD(P)-dependent oxidoreductase n=1 Tax=Streptomyces mobaraensis TaxID=35621 RepID=A0A5N5WF30_STRMB|nr:oxidoreductase [Streptomyces mobaraensis]KAB7850277.1 SDR family NAD(P)-dependent oxidoreductase [Streptomyces mobaraensis]
MTNGWTPDDMPDQKGRTAVVTGANSGIGFVTSRELARRGARVVLACRDETRGRAAEDLLRQQVPGADVRLARLDLADLASVRSFAAELPEERLDLLIDNAGVMALPQRRTVDGFEMHFGTNHLGHFALTGLLLPRLRNAGYGARVVVVSSFMHVMGTVDPRDPQLDRGYRRWTAYARSKSANLLFVHELARRLAADGSPVVAAAAHPGFAATGLQTAAVRMEGRQRAERIVAGATRLVAQSAEHGALPTLYAATAEGIRQDDFIGPGGPLMRGAPARSPRAPWTRDAVASAGLWRLSERLTGVRYGGPAGV